MNKVEILIEPTTAVFLTDADIELFKMFQKNYNVFKILNSKGVFNIYTGKATLNFQEGNLQIIEKQEIVWHR